MINHYQEFQTLASPATGIVEIPQGLWPGEYRYEICNGSPTCQNATGYVWGDIVVSDRDSLWFYTKDGEFKSRMYVFTNDMRDIAYDKEFNRFFATTTDFLRVLVRNDKWLVFYAPRYCEPGSTTMCQGDPMGKPFALKVLDMESSPLTKNMFISGYNVKQMELDGNYNRDTPNAITTNLASQTGSISGMAYTNHYSVETVYSGIGGFYLYYGGYDNGPQNPSNVTRFTAHLQRNTSSNLSYPYVKSLSPINEYIETKNDTLTFKYAVNFSTQMDTCSLIVNNITLEIANNVPPEINQTFVHTFANGIYYWSIRCNSAGLVGASDLRNFTLNYVPVFNQIDWLASQQNAATGLVDSYEGDGQDYAYTYDQALSIIAFTLANETSRAVQILDKMQNLQLTNGAWYQCYNAETGSIGHSGCNFYPTGDISWIIMAINFYESHTGDKTYSETANKALNYLNTMRNTAQDERYGSLRLCSGTACTYPDAISTENNYDAYSAYRYRGILENNQSLIENSNLIKNYLITEMWSNSSESNGRYHNIGVFWVGLNVSVPFADDLGWYTDPQSWGVLALGANYSRALEWLYSYGYTYGSTRHNQPYNTIQIDGFDFWTKPIKNSTWLEGTEGVAAAYYSINDSEKGDYFHNQSKKLISSNGGLIYSFSNTTSDIYFPDNWRYGSVASTAWFYLNEKKINPFILPINQTRVKFRTSNTTYNAFTNISINENCDGNPLNLYSSKLFMVGLKNCTGEYGNSTLLIQNIPYTGGMFGGLWECDLPFQMSLYKYSKGYYVCCKNSAQNYTLSKPYNILLNSTETTESLVPEREIFC